MRSARSARSFLLLALFVATLFSSSAVAQGPAITFVQANSAVPQAPQSTVSVQYVSAQTAGDLNVVVVGWNDSTATVQSLSDTAGNTYALAIGPSVQSGAATQSIYYAMRRNHREG